MTRPFPREIDRAEHGPLTQERHSKHRTSPGRRTLWKREIRVSADVRDMHDPAFERHPPGNALATGDDGLLAQDRPILGLRCTQRARHRAVGLALTY